MARTGVDYLISSSAISPALSVPKKIQIARALGEKVETLLDSLAPGVEFTPCEMALGDCTHFVSRRPPAELSGYPL
jgi:hypothetical protein